MGRTIRVNEASPPGDRPEGELLYEFASMRYRLLRCPIPCISFIPLFFAAFWLLLGSSAACPVWRCNASHPCLLVFTEILIFYAQVAAVVVVAAATVAGVAAAEAAATEVAVASEVAAAGAAAATSRVAAAATVAAATSSSRAAATSRVATVAVATKNLVASRGGSCASLD